MCLFWKERTSGMLLHFSCDCCKSGLGQADARDQEFHPNLPQWWQVSKFSSQCLLLPNVCIFRVLDSGVGAGSWTMCSYEGCGLALYFPCFCYSALTLASVLCFGHRTPDRPGLDTAGQCTWSSFLFCVLFLALLSSFNSILSFRKLQMTHFLRKFIFDL